MLGNRFCIKRIFADVGVNFNIIAYALGKYSFYGEWHKENGNSGVSDYDIDNNKYFSHVFLINKLYCNGYLISNVFLKIGYKFNKQ